ncbi:MAG: hypothetical protein QOI60_108 [Actinomycetota bacterium]|jgi:hypothetical protein|nr:hypothetical protein [Actinomycetota bacterium]
MSTWVTVWFVIGLISASAVVICLVGLVKHLLVLNRTLKVFQEEVAPVAAEIAAGSSRASSTVSNLTPPGTPGR